MAQPWRVEFHCHTFYSKDSGVQVEALIRQARRKKIDRLVITDHNTIGGALAARELAPELVIVGEEILTTRGELLAAFVREEVPAGLPPREAIARLREQGAFISVSHPFDLQRHGWQLPDLLEIAPLVDAVEIFNARCLLDQTNRDAQHFAAERGLPGTAGSDAHGLVEVGRAVLRLPPFASADELRAVIGLGEVEGNLSPAAVHMISVFARLGKRLGWIKQPPARKA